MAIFMVLYRKWVSAQPQPEVDMHDLIMGANWDLTPDGHGGLLEGDGPTIDYQDGNYRVLTNNPDHQLWPVGANLEDLVGKPNTTSTGDAGVLNITQAFTHDGRFTATDLSIEAVPINSDQVQFFVGINNNSTLQSTVPYLTTVINL